MRRRTSAGFTILELLVAMGIFTVLGTMAVAFMQQSLNIFYGGTRDNAFHDRMDAVLPEIQRDLQGLFIGDDFAPPAPPPPETSMLRSGTKEPKARPATPVRLRSGYVVLKNQPTGPLKDYPCFFMAFVVANANEWSNAQWRRGGNSAGAGLKPITPETIEKATEDTGFLPTGGLMEVLWIALPDENQPAIMTLYRGFRAPIGGAETLLDPANYDTVAEIHARCRPVATGLLHFGALWRRAFSKDWNESFSGVATGETDPYVGRVWDSSRGADPKFPFHKGKDSLGDPSDDIFPKFVRLEVTLAGDGPFGYGRGDAMLVDQIGPDDLAFAVTDTDPFMAPRLGRDRWAKLGTEWIFYDLSGVDYLARKMRVQRGARGTKKQGHEARTWIYVGTPFETIVELPVFRDRYVTRGR